MYHYIQTENNPPLYTVGTGHPKDKNWESDSDWSTKEEAAGRVRFLNGGNDLAPQPAPAAPGAVEWSLTDYGYKCNQPGDRSGQYYPAAQVEQLRAALLNRPTFRPENDKYDMQEIYAWEAKVDAALATLDGAK